MRYLSVFSLVVKGANFQDQKVLEEENNISVSPVCWVLGYVIFLCISTVKRGGEVAFFFKPLWMIEEREAQRGEVTCLRWPREGAAELNSKAMSV